MERQRRREDFERETIADAVKKKDMFFFVFFRILVSLFVLFVLFSAFGFWFVLVDFLFCFM